MSLDIHKLVYENVPVITEATTSTRVILAERLSLIIDGICNELELTLTDDEKKSLVDKNIKPDVPREALFHTPVTGAKSFLAFDRSGLAAQIDAFYTVKNRTI